MNSKTTLFLFAAFVGLAGGFWLLRPQKSISAPQTAQTPFDIVDTPSDRQKLVEKEIDEPVKIVIRLEDADVDWIFEKESGDDDSASPKWRMTAPIDTSVASWEMDKFDRQLLKGEYELSYDAGGGDGVTLAKAGLDPPQATVTMTDERGRSATVEIGLPVSAAESYVRLAGTDRICVLDVQLEYLLKKQALDYRDMQVWKIDRESVVGLEIVDRTDAASPVTYTFRKDGARWMIESPVAARGTNKIDELVRSALRLRATRWDDDDPSHFAMYGLAAPVRTVRIEIEKKVESGDEGRDSADDESSEEDPGSPVVPQTERVVHEFHLSDQSPIGEETKVYFRFDDSPVVGRISRTTADKFAPALDQWRDMQLTPAPVKTASRIELTTSAGSAVLFRIDGGQWKFEGDDATAQRSAVVELLDAVSKLKATAFIDQAGDLAEYGFDQPQASITITVPSLPEPERIVIGGYTDPQLKRLVYARRNQATSIAKVQAKSVAALLRAPRAYRDRTIHQISSELIKEVTVVRMNHFVPGQLFLTYKKNDEGWRMEAPEDAPVQEDKLKKFVSALGLLQAVAIAGDASDTERFGLDRPAATVYFTHSDDDQTGTLAITEFGDKWYAQSPDSVVFEIDKGFADMALAEYRQGAVMDFDEATVRSFSIRKSEQTHTFERLGGQWTFIAEPDWPLDQKKVESLLLQIKDLRTRHYAQYQVEDLDSLGLAKPLSEIVVSFEDGTSESLLISDRVCEDDPAGGVFAMRSAATSVFLLAPDMVSRVEVSLDDLERDR